MALTAADVHLWKTLGEMGVIPPKPKIVEFGEANWFGDIQPPDGCGDPDPFEVAKRFYRKMTDYCEIVSLDLQGTPAAMQVDLNDWNSHLFERGDIVINSGTAEHVFNQKNFWKQFHSCCKPNGLMIHAVPVLNWHDHGFYTYSTCFLDDLRDANGYKEILRFTATFCTIGSAKVKVEINRQGNGFPIMLYLAWVKSDQSADGNYPFTMPRQRSIGL